MNDIFHAFLYWSFLFTVQFFFLLFILLLQLAQNRAVGTLLRYNSRALCIWRTYSYTIRNLTRCFIFLHRWSSLLRIQLGIFVHHSVRTELLCPSKSIGYLMWGNFFLLLFALLVQLNFDLYLFRLFLALGFH